MTQAAGRSQIFHIDPTKLAARRPPEKANPRGPGVPISKTQRHAEVGVRGNDRGIEFGVARVGPRNWWRGSFLLSIDILSTEANTLIARICSLHATRREQA